MNAIVDSASPPPTAPSAPPTGPRRRRRHLSWLALGTAALAGVSLAAAPTVRNALTTVSTDDAYVNSDVAFIAPHIPGRVVRVTVDDNNFVRAGQVLVELDPMPFDLEVSRKKAALALAEARLQQAHAAIRSAEAELAVRRYKWLTARDQVRSHSAALRSAVANIAAYRSRLTEAREQCRSAERANAARPGAVPQLELRQRQALVREAEVALQTAMEDVRKARAALDLPVNPPQEQPLDHIPEHWEIYAAEARVALANMTELLFQVGAFEKPPKSARDLAEQLNQLEDKGQLETFIDGIVDENAPSVRLANAELEQARQDLSLALYNRSLCALKTDIDGFVSRRNVQPGNEVQPGQQLMAVRSFSRVWIDANFKETQLADIRIGHPVDIRVDAYPGKIYQGRVSGIHSGTGSTLAVLPPQNATGNFVKVVQRVPVRIELIGDNPPEQPIYAGLSVVPYVRIREQPTGPNAGQRLQGDFPQARP